jgi:hypothetical protein
MKKPRADTVARVAGVCSGVLSAGAAASCGLSGIGRGGNLGAALTAFLLLVLTLAALIVWLVARDITGDGPSQAPPRRSLETVTRVPTPTRHR